MVSHGVDTIVEVGPRQVLSGLIKRITPHARPVPLTDTEVARLVAQTTSEEEGSGI